MHVYCTQMLRSYRVGLLMERLVQHCCFLAETRLYVDTVTTLSLCRHGIRPSCLPGGQPRAERSAPQPAHLVSHGSRRVLVIRVVADIVSSDVMFSSVSLTEATALTQIVLDTCQYITYVREFCAAGLSMYCDYVDFGLVVSRCT